MSRSKGSAWKFLRSFSLPLSCSFSPSPRSTSSLSGARARARKSERDRERTLTRGSCILLRRLGMITWLYCTSLSSTYIFLFYSRLTLCLRESILVASTRTAKPSLFDIPALLALFSHRTLSVSLILSRASSWVSLFPPPYRHVLFR